SVTPSGLRYVRNTARVSGCTPRLTTTRSRPVCLTARSAASAVAVAPSYIDALLTSRPVNSHMTVWYSKVAWRITCETSGWDGTERGVRRRGRAAARRCGAGSQAGQLAHDGLALEGGLEDPL